MKTLSAILTALAVIVAVGGNAHAISKAKATTILKKYGAKAEAAVAIKLVKEGAGGAFVNTGNATHNRRKSVTRNGNIRVGITRATPAPGQAKYENRIFNVKSQEVTKDPSDGRK